jgi:ribosomal protein L32
MDAHVRVCRDCGEEYRPDIVRCADCGGELVDRFPGSEPEPPAGTAEEGADPELEGHRVLFLTPRATDLVPMAERLREARIEYRLKEQAPAGEGAPARYALLVKDGDARAALVALADIVAPHEDAEGVHAVESRFDADRGYVECPACGAHVAPGTVECTECGLGLGGPEGEAEEPRD